jgi:nicotinamidase-related amidase
MKKQNVARPSDLKPTMQEGMADTDFVDGLAPQPHHIVLQKSQPSLFIDTPLDLRLKTMAIDTLVMTGVATDIGIELTCRHGATLGYYSVAVEDATGSYNNEVHERSLAFLRGWTTPVVKTKAILDTWAKADKS